MPLLLRVGKRLKRAKDTLLLCTGQTPPRREPWAPSVLTHASTTVTEEEDPPSLISRWVFAPGQRHSLGWVWSIQAFPALTAGNTAARPVPAGCADWTQWPTIMAHEVLPKNSQLASSHPAAAASTQQHVFSGTGRKRDHHTLNSPTTEGSSFESCDRPRYSLKVWQKSERHSKSSTFSSSVS